MSTDTGSDARAWIEQFIASVDERSAELTELDRQAGDGDYGTNLRSALRRVEANLAGLDDESTRAVFVAVSDAFLNTGGTSGPLFGMWFREFAKALDEPITTPALAVAGTEALAAVQRLGGAQVGHKTMVDAMAPAAKALADAAERGVEVSDALGEAADAARSGAESTQQLLAGRGRASYVGEHARGVVDPGALTVALFFAAVVPARSAV